MLWVQGLPRIQCDESAEDNNRTPEAWGKAFVWQAWGSRFNPSTIKIKLQPKQQSQINNPSRHLHEGPAKPSAQGRPVGESKHSMPVNTATLITGKPQNSKEALCWIFSTRRRKGNQWNKKGILLICSGSETESGLVTLDSESSCLSLPNSGVTGKYHCS